jgi:[ribosomal protein S18]-alanine N-acetyltransferase
MTYRSATLTDTTALSKLEAQLFSAQNYPISRRMFRYHTQRNRIIVAVDDSDKIIGYVLALLRKKWAKLYSLGVLKEHRNEGIASTLLTQLSEQLKTQENEHILLEVRVDNPHAIALYKRHGFLPIRRTPGFYKDGCDALIMELAYA